MIKMIIADDEPTIRKGIRTSIDWSKEGIEIAAEAANGRDALEKINKFEPEIIIMDIRMPKMDGLKTCKNALKEYPKLKIIILSGYDDFSYAQKAIRLGVEDYLLKPFGADELTKKVVRLKKEIFKEKELIEENSSEIFPILINNIVSGDIIESDMKNKFNEYPFDLKKGNFKTVLIDLDYNFDTDLLKQENYEDLKAKIISIFDKTFSKGFLVSIIKQKHLFGVIDYSNREKILKKINLLQERVKDELDISISVFLGRKINNLKELKESYKVLNNSLNSKFYRGSGSVITEPGKIIKEFNKKAEIKILSFDIEDSFNLLEEKNVREKIKKIFNLIKTKKFEVDIAKHILLKLNNMLIDIINESCQDKFIEKKYLDAEEKIKESDTIFLLEKWQFNILDNYFSDLKSKRSKKYNQIVSKAIKYVHSNYDQDITLEQIAEFVHVSPNYFSKLFKEETGNNFIEWLNRYRIDKSKSILANTDKKCYIIAEEVGYNDYRYFSYNFKKYMEISPRKFRKNTKSK